MLGGMEVLHPNIIKRNTALSSLFCDGSLAQFEVVAVVEPYTYEDLGNGEASFPVERNWQLFTPSAEQGRRGMPTELRCGRTTARCATERSPARRPYTSASGTARTR
jgi:hypothetical protein